MVKTNFSKKLQCLLKNIFIKVHKPTSSTQRFKKSIFLIKFTKISKVFKNFYKNNAGRNNSGRITVFSKGIKNTTITIPLSKPFLWDRCLSVVVSIIRSKKKLISLHKHTTGSFSIKPFIFGMYINQKMFSSNLPQNFWINKLPGNLILLRYVYRYGIFSNIFFKNTKKYSLANGTFCQVIDMFVDYNLFKIVLPSKKTKLVSGWCFVIVGRNSKIESKFTFLGKAGSKLLTGLKSKVRGVARNPVDHPHGGRTKTNQPEVSIWGWVAKRNK